MDAFSVRVTPSAPPRHLLKPLEQRQSAAGESAYEYRCALFDLRVLFPTDEKFDSRCHEVTVVSENKLNGTLYRVLGSDEASAGSTWIVPLQWQTLLLQSS